MNAAASSRVAIIHPEVRGTRYLSANGVFTGSLFSGLYDMVDRASDQRSKEFFEAHAPDDLKILGGFTKMAEVQDAGRTDLKTIFADSLRHPGTIDRIESTGRYAEAVGKNCL